MHRLTSVTFIIGVFLNLPAWAAATVESVQPDVSINRGQGFKELVTGPRQASNGDQVMASRGGHGKIVYSDGCVVDVYPGAVVTVQEGSCKVMKPMLLGETCDPKELNCPAAVPGTPWWIPVGAAALIATPIIIVTSQEEHQEHRPGPRSP